jgi:hypothetical protein
MCPVHLAPPIGGHCMCCCRWCPRPTQLRRDGSCDYWLQHKLSRASKLHIHRRAKSRKNSGWSYHCNMKQHSVSHGYVSPPSHCLAAPLPVTPGPHIQSPTVWLTTTRSSVQACGVAYFFPLHTARTEINTKIPSSAERRNVMTGKTWTESAECIYSGISI